MKVVSTLYYLFIIFQLFSWKSNAKQCNKNTKFAPNQVVYTITVSQSRNGDFNKIQQAIDSIPSGNDRWIRIYVNPGRYWYVFYNNPFDYAHMTRGERAFRVI